MVGQKLGHYQVVSELGAGGMGIVYLARDTRLGREVALKLVRQDLADDEELMARFQREARILASLNHPNIAAIHGLEECDGKTFLALEYVEGETLAERLKKRSMLVREAMEVGRQIAEALELAHQKGIIHRDLKPGNIKFTADGKVKVLDFGLARSVRRESAAEEVMSQTVTMAATLPGMVVGTAPYMSPEQVRGEDLDTRSDIWAFGCVLYEMLARRRAVGGQTITEILAAVLMAEADMGKLPEAIPDGVRCLLRRCLQKDARNRLRDIGDARIELEEALGIRESTRPVLIPQSGRRARAMAMASAALAVASLAFAAWLMWGRGAAEPPVTRFSINLPPGQVIQASFNPSLEISPDGRVLFYLVPLPSHGFMPHLRRLDELEPKTMPSITGGVPMFSPDSQWVSYIDQQSGTLRRAALSGGVALTIAPFEWIYRGFWSSDNYLYWTPGTRSGIARTPITGGETTPVTELDTSKNEQNHRFAWPLPGGKEIVFTVVEATTQDFDDAKIVAQSLETGKRKTLVEGGTCPRYSPSGHLLYMRSGNLYAVPLDVKKLEVTAPPVAVVEGVLMSRNTGAAQYTLSETGTLAYVPGVAVDGQRQLFWVDRQGKETPLPLPPRSYLYPHLSPDGKQLAVEIEGPSHDFYLYDFARGVLTKMTLDGLSHAPVWSPDGRQIAYRSWKLGGMTMWAMPADRSGPEWRLLDQKGMQSVVSWSPDGGHIAYVDLMTETSMDVLVLPLKGDRKPVPIAKSKFVEGSPKFSPDGKWVAYCSNESGRAEVFVQPFPGPGPKIQVSTEGGTDPLWRRMSGELYYRNGDKMMAVRVRTQPTFAAERPGVLWEGHYSHGMSSSCARPGVTSFNYDVTADGQRFLMVKDVHQDVASSRINVVLNWTQELKRLAK